MADDDFLAGFTLRDSPAFDEWSYFQRERFRNETADRVGRTGRITAGQGDLETAIAQARRRLALDNLHEPAHRQLMEIYARNNQLSLATRSMKPVCRFCAAELDVEPSSETQIADGDDPAQDVSGHTDRDRVFGDKERTSAQQNASGRKFRAAAAQPACSVDALYRSSA